MDKKALPQSHFQDSLGIGEIQKVFGKRLELAECGHGQGGRLNLAQLLLKIQPKKQHLGHQSNRTALV
jgi:hypothetical protein